MTFNPRTAYANDYQYFDLTETADYHPDNQGLEANDDAYRATIPGIKVREITDITKSDYIAVTLGLELTNESKVFVCWNPTGFDFDPRPNDVIESTEEESESPGSWLIKNAIKSPFSHWVVAVDKGYENE